MAARLAGVLIEAADPRHLAEFWAAALTWRHEPAGDGRFAVRDGDAGFSLVFEPSARPKTAKNRLHLDLADGGDQAGTVQRLLALGAVRADIGQGGVPWEVLADPEGNEFCVLPLPAADGLLAQVCLDAADMAVQGAFWQAVAGWTEVARDAYAVRLRSPAGTGPLLVMGPPAAPKTGVNRLRLAVLGDDATGTDTAGGLAAAGAEPAGDAGFADPEGNEFALLAPGSPGF